jgi:hypothetical protein
LKRIGGTKLHTKEIARSRENGVGANGAATVSGRGVGTNVTQLTEANGRKLMSVETTTGEGVKEKTGKNQHNQSPTR